ncbi:MAG: hypothetical protein IK100_08355 [Muribaculaceae bacterium]|nr:hypothetical protein [Muribaculaceae bacterium]
MKKLSLLAIALLAILVAGCKTEGGSSASDKSVSTQDSVATESTELSQAAQDEHADADAIYTYDAQSNTMTIVKKVDVPDDQPEEDYAEAIVEHKAPEFIKLFKNSTKPGDVTMKEKGATITVKYVNKANDEEIATFDITPEDLK